MLLAFVHQFRTTLKRLVLQDFTCHPLLVPGEPVVGLREVTILRFGIRFGGTEGIVNFSDWLFDSLRKDGRRLTVWEPRPVKRESDPPGRTRVRRRRNPDGREVMDTSQVWLAVGLGNVITGRRNFFAFGEEDSSLCFRYLEDVELDRQTWKKFEQGRIVEGKERYENLIEGLQSVNVRVKKCKEFDVEDEILGTRDVWRGWRIGEVEA
jgi:hypothetical protein